MSVCIDIQSLVEMPIANCVSGDMDGRWTESQWTTIQCLQLSSKTNINTWGKENQDEYKYYIYTDDLQNKSWQSPKVQFHYPQNKTTNKLRTTFLTTVTQVHYSLLGSIFVQQF